MKKTISMLMAIALLAVSAVAFAEGITPGNTEQGMPAQEQGQGSPMRGNRPDGQAPNGQLSSGGRPSGAPGAPGGGEPAMIDFDAMAEKNVISQETCDNIKAYMDGHKPDEGKIPPERPDGEKPAEGQAPPEKPDGEEPAEGQAPPEKPDGEEPAEGQAPPEKPDGEEPAEGQAPPEKPDGGKPSDAPIMNWILSDLLRDGIILQDEYDALLAANE